MNREGGQRVTDALRPGGPPRRAPHTIVVTIEGSIAPTDVARLCARVRDDLDGCTAESLVCDVGDITRADACTLEVIARLALTTRRMGREMQLRHASAPLQDLLGFAGLADVRGLRVEAQREPEERKQVRGVEEERDPADPIA